jgi:hypothetical protein
VPEGFRARGNNAGLEVGGRERTPREVGDIRLDDDAVDGVGLLLAADDPARRARRLDRGGAGEQLQQQLRVNLGLGLAPIVASA